MRAEVHCIHWMTLARCVVATIVAATVPAAFAQRSTPVQLLHPSGATSDQFGQAMAIDGDTMIVGAPFDDVGANANQGAAHIYRWTVSGWTFEATLTAAGGAANDQFGTSVAISGDTAIVGAFFDDVGANTNQGSAYVFVRSGTTWTQQAQLTASGGAANDQFGISVALSGDTAMVGAYLDDLGANSNQGSAYVFTRSGSVWTQQAQLTAADGAASDNFGISVALGGADDTAIVGASVDDVGANTDQGSAYVFTRSGSVWTQQAQLTAADGAAGDNFGISVAVGGADDTAIVGAYFDDVGANTNQGSAYVFTRSDTTWTQQAQLTSTGGASSDRFGISVAFSGDTAIVGAYLDDVGANTDQGSAYVFTRTGTIWTQQAQLTASDGAASDRLGISVALGGAGDTAILGAYLDGVGANAVQGSAWVFSRIGSKWIGPDLQLLSSDGAASDQFGKSVALSGDTAIVGAPYVDVGLADRGSAYVFVRSGTTWTQQAQLTAILAAANDLFGSSVAISGDTAIVGAALDDIGGNPDQGSATVFVRSGTTWTVQAVLNAADGAAGDLFGSSVAISGDTAIVGAYYHDVGANADQGSVYVFVRSGTTWTQQTQLAATGGAMSDYFGNSVAISGDTALVGARNHDISGNTDQGSAYVFTRSGTTWTQQAQISASDGAASDWFGRSVALAGDTAIVGASNDDIDANIDQGSAYIFVRSGTTWTQQAKLIAPEGAAGDSFGNSVAISGGTAVVGAYADDVGANASQGSAYVFTRSGSTWIQQAQLIGTGGAADDSFGNSVAVSDDTAIVGVCQDDMNANSDQGSASVYDVAFNDFSLAQNDVTDVSYLTIAAAMLPATSGQQITATEAAWRGIGTIDTAGRSLILWSSGDLRTLSASTLTLGGSSSLSAASGTLDIFGQLRAQGFVDLYADTFTLGSRGIMTARTGSSLTINAPTAELDGQTRLEQSASLTFAGGVTAIGPTTANLNASLTAGTTFTNIDTFTITAGTISSPLFWNRAQASIFGTSALFGSYTNEAGATTTIRSGTLFVFGSLTNNGTIVGTICSNCVGTPPNLDVGGDLSIGPASNLLMPFVDSVVHVGGSFDCAINANTRYDMSLATLQLEGTSGEQTLEVMSKDLGADPLGLDRTIAGHYPIGVLEFGPSPSTVRLVDTHDNDGLGQSSCEAIYADEVIIHPGSHLINTICRIYYNTLVNNGTVDVPSNLVAFTTGPVCDSIDFNGDGLFPDTADIDDFLSVFSGGPCSTGTCGDTDFNNDGLYPDTLDIDALLSVFSGGPCLV